VLTDDHSIARTKCCGIIRNLAAFPDSATVLITNTPTVVRNLISLVQKEERSQQIQVSAASPRSLADTDNQSTALMDAKVHALGALANLSLLPVYARQVTAEQDCAIVPIIISILKNTLQAPEQKATGSKPTDISPSKRIARDAWRTNDSTDDIHNKAMNCLVNLLQHESCHSGLVTKLSASSIGMDILLELMGEPCAVSVKATVAVACIIGYAGIDSVSKLAPSLVSDSRSVVIPSFADLVDMDSAGTSSFAALSSTVRCSKKKPLVQFINNVQLLMITNLQQRPIAGLLYGRAVVLHASVMLLRNVGTRRLCIQSNDSAANLEATFLNSILLAITEVAPRVQFSNVDHMELSLLLECLLLSSFHAVEMALGDKQTSTSSPRLDPQFALILPLYPMFANLVTALLKTLPQKLLAELCTEEIKFGTYGDESKDGLIVRSAQKACMIMSIIKFLQGNRSPETLGVNLFRSQVGNLDFGFPITRSVESKRPNNDSKFASDVVVYYSVAASQLRSPVIEAVVGALRSKGVLARSVEVAVVKLLF
jgi:hypothetical protein